ncbi:MAG: hypothetical protein ACK56F_16265 [bacterium]
MQCFVHPFAAEVALCKHMTNLCKLRTNLRSATDTVDLSGRYIEAAIAARQAAPPGAARPAPMQSDSGRSRQLGCCCWRRRRKAMKESYPQLRLKYTL